MGKQALRQQRKRPPILRICRFEGRFAPQKPYLCLNNEMCCKEGCCLHQTYRFFNSWYFWLGLLLIFAFYRYISWYCQKLEQRSRNQAAADPSEDVFVLSSTTPTCSLPGASSTMAKPCEPPPQYSIAINLPKPDDVPSYEQATKL